MNQHDKSWSELKRSKTMREIEDMSDPWDTYIVIVSVILLVWILLGAPL